MEQFDSTMSSVIDSTLGLRCKLFGYSIIASKNLQKSSAIQNISITLLSVIIAIIVCISLCFSTMKILHFPNLIREGSTKRGRWIVINNKSNDDKQENE